MFRRRRPYRKWLALLLVLTLVCGVYLFFDLRVRPTLLTVADVQVTRMAVEAINKTVQQEVTRNNIGYQDFITVHRDYNGRVALMQANTLRINKLAADITLDVQQRLRGLEREQVSVPFGQIMGSRIFADLGPRISIRIYPMGVVNVDVMDSFEQPGINQTRHKIYLDFTTMVRVVIPLYSGEVEVVSKVPVAESIIVGDVPDAVINLPSGILGSGGLR